MKLSAVKGLLRVPWTDFKMNPNLFATASRELISTGGVQMETTSGKKSDDVSTCYAERGNKDASKLGKSIVSCDNKASGMCIHGRANRLENYGPQHFPSSTEINVLT